jgi:lambda family phage tail tape measure protein
MNILARLGVKLGLNTAEFTAGIEKTERELKRLERNAQQSMKRAENASKEFGATMGKVAIGVGAVGFALTEVLKKADEYADTASAFDSSIGSIIGMGKALELSGGKAEDTTKLLSKLSQSANEAREGSDKLRIAFREIGISAKEVQNLNPDELFNRVAEQLAKIADPVERNAKAFELLGKSAKGIDWKKYTAEYKEVADPDLVQAIQTSAEAWDNIQKGAGKTFYFIVKMIQPLSALLNDFLTLADRYKEFKQEGGTINFDPNNPMGEGIEFQGEGKPKSTKPEAPKRDISKLGDYKELSAEDRRIASAREQLRIASDRNALEIRRIELEGQRAFMNEYDYKRQLESYELDKVTLDLRTKINDLEKQKNKENATSTKIAIEGLQQQIEYEKQKSEAKQRNIDMEQKNAQSWAYGWEQAFKKFNEDAMTYSKVGADMFNSLVGSMNSAIDNFVKNGKFAFKDFAKSVIQDLIAIQLKAQAMQLFKGVGGLLGGVLGGAFGGGQTGLASLPSSVMSGFADGGSPPVGVPSIVGERGAELFIPKQAGTIVPHNQLSSVLGTGTTINYNAPVVENLSAIDTQSGMQFLMKNKESIWSANQSASRSLPTSR